MHQILNYNGEEIGLDKGDCDLQLVLTNEYDIILEWLDEHTGKDEANLVERLLLSRNHNLAILNWISVSKSKRRSGHATQMLKEVFLPNIINADVCVLLVDSLESVLTGCNLIRFYEKFGFQLASSNYDDYPLMYRINKEAA